MIVAILSAGRLPWPSTKKPRFYQASILMTVAVLGPALTVGPGVSPAQTVAQVWRLQHVPSSPDSDLEGVSCPSATDCVAVGARDNRAPGPARPLIETWSPSGWSNTKAPQPPLVAPGADLASVACASAASCVAVGGDGTFAPDGHPFSEVLKAGAWHIVPTATVTAAVPGSVVLSSVSCWTPTGCDAGGTYTSLGTGTGGTIVETFNGTSWSLLKTVVFPDSAYFTSISCLPATVPALCVAVGSKGPASSAVPLVELSNGGSFQGVPVAAVPGAQTSVLTSLSCPQPSSCVAVGITKARPDGPSRSFSEVEDLHNWGIVSPAPPPVESGQGLAFNGVSCPLTISVCVAVGAAGTTGPSPLAEAELLSPARGAPSGASLSKWRVSATLAPKLSGFTAVSCPLSASVNTLTCTAVGYYQPGKNREMQAMAARI